MASSSQQTAQVTEKTVQNVAVPAPAHSLPQELIAAGYQPYYQPYPGQQAIAPPPVQTSKRAELTRLGFHGIAVVLGAIGLGLSLGSLQGGAISGALAGTPAAGLALIWSIAEIITRATRKFQSGIHPGAHVGMCLIIWLVASISGGILCTYVALNPPQRDESDCYYGSYDSEGNLETYNMCEPADPYPWGKILGTAVVTCLLFGLYFGLFIDACICTHRRNAAASRPIMVIAQPQNWPAATTSAQGSTVREYYAPA